MSTSTISLPVGVRTVRGRGRLRAYFWSDNQRAVQTVLGLVWLLDGGLQFQSFMYSKGFLQQLAAGAVAQPGWLAGSIAWGTRLAGGDLILWNTLFALTQVAVGVGLLSRRTVRPALGASFVWVLIVWWFGEGLGMVFANMAQPLTGAPGAVLLYGLVGLVAWPTQRPGGLLGVRGAKTMWAGLWLVMACLWLEGASSSANATRDAILGASSGVPWVTHLQSTVASGAAGNGVVIALTLALASALIGVAVAAGWRPRFFLGLAIVLNVVYWVLPQGLGGVLAGGATDPDAGPLFVLLACAMYPLFPTEDAPATTRESTSVVVRRASVLLLSAVAAILVAALGGVAVNAAARATARANAIRLAAAGGHPLAQPAVYTSHHGVLNVTLVASEKRVEIAGQMVLAKVYNGSFVAPTLMIHPGDMVRLKLVNNLDEPTNLHFHGLEISPSGHADNIFLSINPGQSFQYYFRLPRDAPTGTFWYHSHEMVPASEMSQYPNANSEEQVFDGLSGLIEVEGLTKDLPPPMRRLPQRYLALRDVQTSGGQIVSTDIDSNAPTTRLVDGQVDPRIKIAPGQTQLWHIANIGADIFYRLSLPGHTFDVIAQDGHPVLHTQQATTIVLPPGKRYDVLIRGDKRGVTALRTLPFNEGDDHYPERTLATLVTTGRPQIPQSLPHSIFPGTVNLARMPIVRQRIVTLSENRDGSMFFINGEFYDPSKINFYARLNTVEQWVVVNSTDELHVFHMHTYPMQLLSVNGVPTPFNGYQDEADLPPHGYIVLRLHLTQFTGITVFHCHILAHEDMGMMANIEVTK
ncbi:MAG TPA: multicopper oxidase family protein [Solirubrobacteraceae bacterium]